MARQYNPTQIRRTLLLAFAAFWLGGCATSTYDVKINAIANSEKPSGESYRIVAKNGGDPRTDLRTKEAVDYVKTALSGRGLYEAPNPETADMVIEIDYDVEPPRVEFETRSVPIFARTQGGLRSVVVPTRDASGTVTYRRVTVMDAPSQELVGFDEQTVPVTVYEKYLRVSARENVASGDDAPPSQLWSVYATNEAEDNDIRSALPMLASVVGDYIGVTTEKDTKVKVNTQDEDVAFIKKGM